MKHLWAMNTLLLGCVVLLASGCQERSAGIGGRTPEQLHANPVLEGLVKGDSLDEAVAAAQIPSAERARFVDQVRRVYREVGYQLIWIDEDRPSIRYAQFVEALARAENHGLPAALYQTPIGDPSDASVKWPAGQSPELDVKMTAVFLRYFSHLTGGRLDPGALEPMWTLKPEKPDLVAALATAVKNDDLPAAMDRLRPQHSEYRELEKALIRYRSIAAKGGWPSIPPDTRLKLGHQSAVVPLLRQRLAIEGDLDASHEKNPSSVFDAIVVAAVKRFEARHRIAPDGTVDADTVRALNVPVARRIRLIELNLERWRWLPDPMPERYVVVNVPDFRLEAMEHGTAVFDMRVVVGAADNKTPIFADTMTHVVFSPYWNVPPGIAAEETIPKALSDPGFLSRNNMEVVGESGEVVDPASVDWSGTRTLRIRQRPGSGNALGGVKFMFPNNFDVYLHDTNATRLFDRIERSLSHGCVRVEEPHKLAQYVLRDQGEWTPAAIGAAMKSGTEKHVKLKTPIPVFILYKTAWVHEGGVRFLKDIYGHDAAQEAKLWPEYTERGQPALKDLDSQGARETRRR